MLGATRSLYTDFAQLPWSCPDDLQFCPARSERFGQGWSSWGVLPFRGVDFKIVKAPTQYVYISLRRQVPPTPPFPLRQRHSRAFSTDLRNWTLDPKDFCSTSGDLCAIGGTRAGVLPLPDGRIRMFLIIGGRARAAQTPERCTVQSLPMVFWTQESGIRSHRTLRRFMSRAGTPRTL